MEKQRHSVSEARGAAARAVHHQELHCGEELPDTAARDRVNRRCPPTQARGLLVPEPLYVRSSSPQQLASTQ